THSLLSCYSRSRDHRDLHAFPTRRSSDLIDMPAPFGKRADEVRYADWRMSLGGEQRYWLDYGEFLSLVLSLPDKDWQRVRGEVRSEEHTSELQSRENLVCRLLLEKKKRHR